MGKLTDILSEIEDGKSSHMFTKVKYGLRGVLKDGLNKASNQQNGVILTTNMKYGN